MLPRIGRRREPDVVVEEERDGRFAREDRTTADEPVTTAERRV
jgi:hypothetical protein